MEAVRHETERVRQWNHIVSQRKANILGMLNECLAGVSDKDKLPPEKKAAVRKLRAIADKFSSGKSDFYLHAMEMKKRRKNTGNKNK